MSMNCQVEIIEIRLAIRQILGLQKLLAYAEDNSLFDPRQNQLRQQSLELWRVQSDNEPEGANFPKERFQQIKGNSSLGLRLLFSCIHSQIACLVILFARQRQRETEPPNSTVSSIMTDILSKLEVEMVKADILDSIKSPFDWRVVIVGGSLRRRGHYLGKL